RPELDRPLAAVADIDPHDPSRGHTHHHESSARMCPAQPARAPFAAVPLAALTPHLFAAEPALTAAAPRPACGDSRRDRIAATSSAVNRGTLGALPPKLRGA